MHEHRRAAPGAMLEEGEQLGRVEVEFDDAVAAGGVDVRANFNAAHAQIVHAAVEFAAGEFGVLHRHGAKSEEARRMGAHHAGNVVVQKAAQLKRGAGGLVVGEHHGNRRKHLHRHAMLVALANAGGGVPAVGFDVAKRLAVDGQTRAGAARTVNTRNRLDRRPTARARLLGEIGPRRRQDVGVEVDHAHAGNFAL